MPKIALTGSHGFLGWHTRAALQETGIHAERISVGSEFNADQAVAALNGAEKLIHLAGVNRGTDTEIRENNIRFAEELASSILRAEDPPKSITFANSTQSTNGSVYGEAKKRAAEILHEAANTRNIPFFDISLPNLFGEHGKPFYNAVTSTFCHLVAQGEQPEIVQDKELTLMHAQNAADLLIGNSPLGSQSTLEVQQHVSQIAHTIENFARIYSAGEIPDVSDPFERDLFNTFRSYTFPAQAPVKLNRHADARGSFFEIIRSHGGAGQSSFSTTVPGISRGDHFHRRKIERFTVLSGTATISLRKLFSEECVTFHVTGDAPVAVDMPTMWSHKIENTGTETLFTSFWTNDIFDPQNPDTIAEMV